MSLPCKRGFGGTAAWVASHAEVRTGCMRIRGRFTSSFDSRSSPSGERKATISPPFAQCSSTASASETCPQTQRHACCEPLRHNLVGHGAPLNQQRIHSKVYKSPVPKPPHGQQHALCCSRVQANCEGGLDEQCWHGSRAAARCHQPWDGLADPWAQP